MNREKINLNDNTMDILFKMSEGNPGAMAVMNQIIQVQSGKGVFTILELDDMNIRGSQIWIAYKDHCQEDIQKFIKLINKRDQDLVNTVNQNYSTEIAVTSGASFER